MLLALALQLSTAQIVQAKAEIERWCAANQPAEQQRCADDQYGGLKRFRMLARYYGFNTAPSFIASNCLRQSAQEPSLDWSRAASCLSTRQSFDSTKWQREPTPPPILTPYPNFLGQNGR